MEPCFVCEGTGQTEHPVENTNGNNLKPDGHPFESITAQDILDIKRALIYFINMWDGTMFFGDEEPASERMQILLSKFNKSDINKP